MKPLFVLLICVLFVQCKLSGGNILKSENINSNTQNSSIKKQGKFSLDSAIVKLIKRPQSPIIKIKKEFQVQSKGAKPYLIQQTEYDENGAVLLEKKFDFFGSGKQVGSTINKYNTNGNLIASTVDDNEEMTFYAYIYNSKNQKIKETWKRKNGLGEITEFIYNEKGDIVEKKYLTLKGKHDSSRIMEYEYDDEGNIITEKGWEKYTDGSTDLLQYHYVNEYERGNLIKQLRLTKSGKPDRVELYNYDSNGLMVMELEGTRRSRSKTVYTYNEYGELVDSKIFSIAKDNAERLDIHSANSYDEYGNITGYSNIKGSIDSNGTKFEYIFYK